jgi:hypothetical protein
MGPSANIPRTFVVCQGAWRSPTLAVGHVPRNVNANLNANVNRLAILERQLPV